MISTPHATILGQHLTQLYYRGTSTLHTTTLHRDINRSVHILSLNLKICNYFLESMFEHHLHRAALLFPLCVTTRLGHKGPSCQQKSTGAVHRDITAACNYQHFTQLQRISSPRTSTIQGNHHLTPLHHTGNQQICNFYTPWKASTLHTTMLHRDINIEHKSDLIIQPADQLQVTAVILSEHNTGTLLGHQQA